MVKLKGQIPVTLTFKQRKQNSTWKMKSKNGHFIFLVQSTLTEAETVLFVLQGAGLNVMEIYAKIKLQQVESVQSNINYMKDF